jgi:hypothetical protein
MMCRNLLMMAAALALVASTAGSARSADEPTSEEVRAYAFEYMKQFPKSMSDRPTDRLPTGRDHLLP